MNVFELTINKDAVTTEDFQQLYTSITGYLGAFSKVRFHIILTDKRVRYLIESTKDLSPISSNVPFCVIVPASESDAALPKATSKERFVNFVTGGTLLELREKLAVKRGKNLEHFVCDVQKITAQKAMVNISIFFKNAGGEWSVSKKNTTKFPAHLFAFDFKTANTFMKKETPKYLNIEKSLHMFVPENINSLLEVDTFPYFPKPYYLNLPAYEFDKHSLIVGASGSGKSRFIQLLIDRMKRMPNSYDYRIIVIDPHANLASDLKTIDNSKVFDFNGETTELFAGAEADISAATELTSTLLKDLIGDNYNARTERVVRFSLFVLFTAQTMSLGMLKRFLTEVELRQQILDHVQGHVPHNISHFFATDFNEIRTSFYNESIMPIIAIVDELELQPALLGEGGVSMNNTVRDNFLTVFSLNKVSMGEKAVKTVAGLIIQQIFLLAQSRAFGQRVILIIDEVSVVQNPALSAMLSEARKFNLFVVLTQQYLSQVDKELKDSIFANTSNYYCFRVSEEDATQLVGNLPMELQKEMLEEAKSKGIKEETVKVRMLTDLSPRECVVRLASNGLLLPCFKARTLDIGTDAVAQTTVPEKKLKAYSGEIENISKFIEKAEKTPAGTPVEVEEFHADPTTPKPANTEPVHKPPPKWLYGVELEEFSQGPPGPITVGDIMRASTTKEQTKKGEK